MMRKWPRVAVKDVCSLIVDCVNRTAPIVEHDTPYRMIRTTNVKEGRIDLSSCRRVDERTYERWTRRAKLLDGDVILTREAPIGEVGYVSGLGPVFLGQRLMQYRPDPKKVVPRYLYYAFRSTDLQHQFGSHEGSGSVVSHIRVADCHEFKVSLPPIRQQELVVDLLGSIDDKIELNRRMNDTLEAMAQAIFRDWFVDFGPTRRKIEGASDPAEIMGRLVTDPKRLRQRADLFPAALGDDGLPATWNRRSLLTEAQLVSGGTPKTTESGYWGGAIKWASAKDVSQCASSFLLDTERTITDLGLRKSAAKIVPRFATVLVARGATTGRYCMFGDSFAMNQTCYGLVSRRSAPFFLNQAFGALVESLVQAAHGSVFDTVTTKTLEMATVVDPGEAPRVAYEALAGPLIMKVLENLRESKTLVATRDLLLPKLMSGEITIRDAEQRLEAAQ